MTPTRVRRFAAGGLGALTLAAGTFVFATRGIAQGEDTPRREGEVRRDRREGEIRRDGDVPREGRGPADRPDARSGFPGPFPGGPPGMMMGMGPMMPGTTMTATPSTVYVLRGNTLFAFDANTLRLRAKTELPAPEFRPPGPGGPGGPGFGAPGGGIPGSGGAPGRREF